MVGKLATSLRLAHVSVWSRMYCKRAVSRSRWQVMAKAEGLNIVGISGSLRKASTNTGLLHACRLALPAGVSMDIAETGDLPMFNEDLEVLGDPLPVARLREQVQAADALIFAMPEYNYTVSPSLKNVIDWLSRGPGGNVWNNKPAAILSSGGSTGGARAQYHFRQIAVYINLRLFNKPELMVRKYDTPPPFDADGKLTHEPTQTRLGLVVAELIALTQQLRK